MLRPAFIGLLQGPGHPQDQGCHGPDEGGGQQGRWYTLAPLRLPIDEDQGANMPVKLLGVAMVHGLEPDDVLHASGEVGDLSQVPMLVD